MLYLYIGFMRHILGRLHRNFSYSRLEPEPNIRTYQRSSTLTSIPQDHYFIIWFTLFGRVCNDIFDPAMERLQVSRPCSCVQLGYVVRLQSCVNIPITKEDGQTRTSCKLSK